MSTTFTCGSCQAEMTTQENFTEPTSKACFSCGASVTFTPGEAAPATTEASSEEKPAE